MSSSVINFPPDRLQKIENRFKNSGFRVGIVPALIDPSKEKEPSDEELRNLSKLFENSLQSQTPHPAIGKSASLVIYNRKRELVTHFIDAGIFQNLIA